MARIETLDMNGIDARIAELEGTLTALINAQAATDAVTFAPVAEPVAVAESAARAAAIAQEVIDRDAAIDDEVVARNNAIEASTVKTVLARRTAGNVTVNSNAAWANIDTAIDLVLPAVVGDLIEVSVSGIWGAESANVGFLDVVSIVGGNPVNSWGVGGAVVTNPQTVQGVQAWRGEQGVYCGFGGAVSKRVVAGDISGGNVTLRLRAATSAASNKTFYAGTVNPFCWHAKNLRQG